MDPEKNNQKQPNESNHPLQSSQQEERPALDTTPATYTGTPIQLRPKRTFGQKLGALLRSKKFWFSLLGILLIGLATSWFIGPSRLWIANTFGGTNTLTITTISPGEGNKARVAQLRNVEVTVNGKRYKTDDRGKVQVSGVLYGKATISAKKTGFADVNYGVTLDFDPFFHKFGGQAEDNAMRNIELSMQGVGLPVAFKVIDYLSGKPVTAGDFAVGDVVAKPNDQGEVSLKVPATDDKKVTVSATFGGTYIDKKFDIDIGAKTVQSVGVVPGGKHYFVSKRTGVLTVYSSNLDGSDVQTIVTGTGKETDSIAFAVSPDGKYGVLSSSREGTVDAKNNTMQGVYVVDLSTKQMTRVDTGVYVNFADWSGNTLVYTANVYDQGSNAIRTTLRSVDTVQHRVFNFETADTITADTVAFNRVVYHKYTYSGAESADSPVLREATINGDAQKTLGDNAGASEGYIQLDFDRIAFRTDQDQAWHEYNLNADQLKTISQPVADNKTQQFLSTASIDGSKRLVIDRIDGKFTLYMKEGSGARKQLYAAGGLGGPIRWIGDVVVFRIVDGQQTADYAVSINGGEPKKITDVTATASTQGSAVDRFRFY